MTKQIDGIEIEGMKEFNEILKGLPMKFHQGALKAVHRGAANLVKKEIIARSPEGADKYVKVGNDPENPTAIVVGIKKKSGSDKRGFIYRFHEYGTSERTTRQRIGKGVRSTGKMSEKPFVRPAIDASVGDVLKYLATDYGKKISRYLKGRVRAVNKKLL